MPPDQYYGLGTLCLFPLFFSFLSLVGMVSYGGAGIVWPTTAFLFFALAGHLYAMGILGEMLLYSGDYHPEQMIKGTVP